MVYESIKKEKLSLQDAEKMTNFVDGKPTWPFKSMLSFAKSGFKVMNIEDFAIDIFIIDPIKAIKIQISDEKIADTIISISNIQQEKMLATECKSHPNINFFQKIPELDDIKKLINEGYFLICNVNYWSLLNEDKYAGHFVIIEDITNTHILLQNPGLPPIKDQNVTHEQFLKAWRYPDKKAANIIAVR